ncbi:hypothetical protein [Caballeronia sp. BCC1704]|nr:hypothetical protein [Caballeronia sp. BCC1704]
MPSPSTQDAGGLGGASGVKTMNNFVGEVIEGFDRDWPDESER